MDYQAIKNNPVVKDLAERVIFWQKRFNESQDALQKADGKNRLGVIVEPVDDVIDYSIRKFTPITDNEEEE
jgi:hypothetical protein